MQSDDMIETEELIGGMLDGEQVNKSDVEFYYGGRFGDGKINIYKRSEDGKLHFNRRVNAKEFIHPFVESCRYIDSTNQISVEFDAR